MQHPNKDLDPDCTNPAALGAAIEIKEAAETFGLFVAWLNSLDPTESRPIIDVKAHLEAIHAQVHAKHEGLRIILGLAR